MYVTEIYGARVSEFQSDGTFVRLWGFRVNSASAGEGFETCEAVDALQCTIGFDGGRRGGGLVGPYGIAADSSGAVYVSDDGHHRIQKFTADGDFVLTWGLNVINNGAAFGPEICTVAVELPDGGSGHGRRRLQ